MTLFLPTYDRRRDGTPYCRNRRRPTASRIIKPPTGWWSAPESPAWPPPADSVNWRLMRAYPVAPFGGYRLSGNGREWGQHGLAEFTETKAVMGYGDS